MDYDEDMERVDTNDLGILFLSSTSIPDHHIKEFKGIFEDKILIKNQKSLISKNKSNEEEILIKNLRKAMQQALINLSNQGKNKGFDAIFDLTIEFDTLSGLKEDNVHIVVHGTGVKLT